jgi:hypothetical protein
MKKLKFILLLMLVALSTQLFAGKPNPAKYNNKIVSKQHKVVNGFKEFFKTFEKGTKERMHDEREELLALVNKSINEIKVMDAFDGDAELRDGALSLLNFYKSGLEGDYHKMIELIANRERSKEDHAKLEAYKDGLIANEKIHDDKFEDLQIAFAKKHKLDLL